MFLNDTDVVSELGTRDRADRSVLRFFARFAPESDRCFLSVATIGELRHGAERIRHRGDIDQARALESWLRELTSDFGNRIQPTDREAAELWGRLRVPDAGNSSDELMAAAAPINDLTVVTRDVRHFQPTGVSLSNPFE